ncbi:MAG: hypothetical protein HYY92_00610 [Parcubacteria group bacterium]|nr:hypothetical protein [Parcubacteria group bacterium]
MENKKRKERDVFADFFPNSKPVPYRTAGSGSGFQILNTIPVYRILYTKRKDGPTFEPSPVDRGIITSS